MYLRTFNDGSAKTIKANRLYSSSNGGTLGLNIQGQNMKVGVWDGGIARDTHVEFGGRVYTIDATTTEDHATHVMGTILAEGRDSSLRGIAFQAQGFSLDWNNDLGEMAKTLQNRNTLVSNHSYGLDTDGAAIWNAGAYTSSSRSVDALVFISEFYLPFFAAGNERNNNPQWNPADSGYDLINGKNSAKNVVTVGAVNSITNYIGPTSVVMSSFSSWGPTDDGRIKPDVVAKGVFVRSTTASSNTASGVQQGTSMACPAAAGVGLLLQQHYMNLNQDEPMLAATLKGLILHTADEAGLADGPDYRFGWGLINAEKAANVLSSRGQTSVVKELILQNNATYTTTVQVGSTKPLVASISWTDRAPAPNTVNNGTIDLQTLMLVNDLDVRITKDSEVYFPWTLDPANPSFAATNLSENFRDNFEKIEIALPEQGVYTISIKHKGTLVGGNQKFSLIVTGDSVVETLNNTSFSENDFKVYPNPANNVLNVISTTVSIESYEIYDVLGRIVRNKTINSTNQFDISELKTGVYFIKLFSGYNETVKRFIKN
ncbi:S8 family serine peptidase [Flavobacterium sp.]|uniref:S8 family serine peptidase n=1 Tax=Flavobacterium sp. TaxID=239 RepID=UPI0037BF1492